MKCPYCGSTVTRVHPENIDQLFVTGEDDTYDFDVSMWQCDAQYGHEFYADDKAGNDWSSTSEMRRQ